MVIFSAHSLRRATRHAGLQVMTLASTARISRFVWRISTALTRDGLNAYHTRPTLAARVGEMFYDASVRLRMLWDRDAGDELFLVASR
jgi:hypothetical protein